jgi:hypothetical protein
VTEDAYESVSVDEVEIGDAIRAYESAPWTVVASIETGEERFIASDKTVVMECRRFHGDGHCITVDVSLRLQRRLGAGQGEGEP